MDKIKLLNDLKEAVNNGTLTRGEVDSVLGFQPIVSEPQKNSLIRRLGISEIFYLIGGIIVLIGLVVLVAQNWMAMSYSLRVFSTFGAGVAFFIGAVALTKNRFLGKLDDVFYILSAILTAIGYSVIFMKFINQNNVNVFLILVPLFLLIQYGITQFFTKKNTFTLFNAVFGTWLFFTLTNVIISNSASVFGLNFHLYRVMLVGISYLLFGYFLQSKQRPFASFFDFFGILGILGPSFALNVMAGIKVSSSFISGSSNAPAVWLFLYPVLVVATLFASIYLKKTSFLTFGTIFLVAYLIRITAQYFSNVIGWPIALIFMGIVVIGLGYLAVYINKKYIKI